jgi:hypothetical protein
LPDSLSRLVLDLGEDFQDSDVLQKKEKDLEKKKKKLEDEFDTLPSRRRR